MAKAQKRSTLTVYQGKWDMFVKWCQDCELDPYSVTVPYVAEFLCFLHEKRKLALSTIEGYCTAISKVIKAKSGLDLGRNQELTNLLANFARDNPVK